MACALTKHSRLTVQRTNEHNFRRLVDLLEQPSIVANARQAINAMLTPQVKTTNSRPDRMTLRLGDPIAHPESSITIFIDVKKATTPAAPPSMKQMSLRGFERVQAQAQSQNQSQSQAQAQAFRGTKRKAEDDDNHADEDEELKAALKAKIRFEERQNREMRAQMSAGQGVDLGKLGVTFDKALREEGLAVVDEEEDLLASHLVLRESQYYYRPTDKSLNDKGMQRAQYGAGDGLESDAEDEDRGAEGGEHLRSAANAELTDAYYYGGTLVPVGDLEDDVGTLTGNETGMEIVSFMKEADVSRRPSETTRRSCI